MWGTFHLTNTTVLRLEAIRERIANPPTVQPLFFRDVFICQAMDPIGEAAKMMLKSSFSQVPVYKDEIFEGLLTTQTIARWLAAKLETGIGLLEEESVKNVLTFSEYDDNYRFIKRNTTLYDVSQYFDDFVQKGRNLDALIITHSGKSNEKPLGIVTIFDLPEVFRNIVI
jgi:predicted transcriptional regulator